MPKQWGAVLQGHEFDLQDWRDMLKPPFDPWVEVHGADTVLRSNSFGDLTSSNEVRDRAVTHIERLNGAMFVAMQGQPLQFGGVIEFASDGKHSRTLFAEGFVERARLRMHAVAVVIGPDGVPKPNPPPKESDVQRWAAIADTDDLLEDALIFFGRASPSDHGSPPTFWFDIYKALECLIEKFGGAHKFCTLNWAPKAQIENLKRTADWGRHASRSRRHPPPPNPTTKQEAYELMAKLLRKAFEAGDASRP
ncbi:hypothetical protein [Bradyrhizobium sp. 33ap4]|uniref:hypothetical protein n=1 Tax=Bradyrhizobium sp. 33ap4 TaxID=3061630 RepID=UPI00292D6F08|nr:hypothetical protein [Bradyrhizobium sp. 33ap4]